MKAWQLTSAVQTNVERGDRVLGISISMVAGSPWHWVLAIVETSKASADKGAADVLDNHAHELLEAGSLTEALQLAERYCKWWQGNRATHFQCECGPIEKSA
jgi:hypothetical protein